MIHEFLRGFFQSTLVSLSDSMSIRKVLIFTSVFAGSKVVYLRFFQNPWRRGILHRCRWLLSPVTTIAITAALPFAATLHAAPAQALNNRSFVPSTGNNANPCTRALPCRNIKVAHDNPNPGGEINP